MKRQNPKTGRIETVYKTKVVRVKKNGKTIRKRVPVTKVVKKGGKKVRVKVPKRAACSKTKLCVVKKKGKTVYLTKLAKVRVIRGNRIVTVKKRVFIYKTVIKKVKGKKKRVKVKVAKLGKCSSKQTSGNSGVPVNITISDGSVAHLDFGGFQRDIDLSGKIQGFIVGDGFKLGEDNRIELTRGKINLAPTGIFIDDVCKGRVTDSIRTDPNSFAEVDETKTGSAVNVAANSSVTGRIYLRIQTALQMRNDDDGCDSDYITTGWTDFSIPLFIKGTLGAGGGGLQSKLTTGETVLNDLSACLAPGKPTLPCNGFAIPFPAIFTSKIVAQVKVG